MNKQSLSVVVPLKEQIEYVKQFAYKYQEYVIGYDSFVLFASDTGDAWLLQPIEQAALPLCLAGIDQEYKIREVKKIYVISWYGMYRIGGDIFTVQSFGSQKIVQIYGYPTERINNAEKRIIQRESNTIHLLEC